MSKLWLNTTTGEVTARDDPPPALLPCPFCGGKASYLLAWGVKCRDCGAGVPCFGNDFTAWNRRAPAQDGDQ